MAICFACLTYGPLTAKALSIRFVDPVPWTFADVKVNPAIKSIWKIHDKFDNAGCKNQGAADTAKFVKEGQVKFICPFGYLISAHKGFPDEYMKYAANVFANLIDLDGTGKIVAGSPQEKILNQILAGKICSLGGANKAEEELSQEQMEKLGITYSFSMQAWKGLGSEKDKTKDAQPYWDPKAGGDSKTSYLRKIIFEEMFHMTHQYGYAKAFPEQFGVDSFTQSILSKEVARIQCCTPGWHHSENGDCPKVDGKDVYTAGKVGETPKVASPLKKGKDGKADPNSCAAANCDVVEFYQQAALINVGAKPGWESEKMPKTKENLQKMLDPQLKTIMADKAKYWQIQKDVPFDYEVKTYTNPSCSGTTSADGSCDSSTAKKTGTTTTKAPATTTNGTKTTTNGMSWSSSLINLISMGILMAILRFRI